MLAAVVALGGGGASPRKRDAISPTVTATRGQPPNAPRVRELLARVPSATRDTCKPAETFGATQLARVSCQRWGGTVFFELFTDALEARSRFSVDVELAEEALRGPADACQDADVGQPFSGTWARPGRSKPAGQILCSFSEDGDTGEGFATREWTVEGSPVVATIVFLDDRRTATEGVRLAWEQATRGPNLTALGTR
jgi:hypothetical protein